MMYDLTKLFDVVWYTDHPTLEESGIGIGGFKKPLNIELNVDVGDLAKINGDEYNDGLIVKVIKYAGERPWWRGCLFCEDHGPCWIVESLSRPFEVHYERNSEVNYHQKMPVPDHMLDKVY